MQKQEAIDILARHRGQAISVATMQAAAPWHAAGQGKAFHVDASACMGSASSLGLGLVLVIVVLALVAIFVIGTWAGANFLGWNFTGDRVGGWGWFFNPFAWQLVFFTGFAFMRGWLPTPPRDSRLMWAAIAFCVICAPFSCQYGFACYAGWGYAPALGEIHDWLEPVRNKTYQGPLRFAHFLATVYLAWYFVGERGANLTGPIVEITRRVGQQTLAVFLVGIVAAQTLGIALDIIGRNFFATAAANVTGTLALITTAYVVAWFKAPPWKKKATAQAARPVETTADPQPSPA